MKKLVLLTLISGFVCAQTDAFMCYDCNSFFPDQQCDVPNEKTPKINCNENKPSIFPFVNMNNDSIVTAQGCRKTIMEVPSICPGGGNDRRILRQCAFTKLEEKLEGKQRKASHGIYITHYFCPKEECNSAAMHTISWLVFLCGLIRLL